MTEPLDVDVGFLLHGTGTDAKGVSFHKHGFYGEGFAGKPYQPTDASGVTLDYGYDLAHHSRNQFLIDWVGILGTKSCNRLTPALGLTGAAARAVLVGVRDIRWTKDQARGVFEASILPRYAALTDGWVPGWRALPRGTRTALLSLVINRGSSKGTPETASWLRREEFRVIPEYVKEGHLPMIAAFFRTQKHLWLDNTAKDDDALAARRECEALLIEADYPPGAPA